MVFVTGGTGVLGSHLLVELISRGYKVRALKRTHSNLKTVRSVFDYYLNDRSEEEFNKIEWVNGDIHDITSLIEGISGCEEVFHCAAIVSFKKRDFNKMWKTNKIGTENVVNVCLSTGVQKLCHVSSTAAIGKTENDPLPYTEDNKWVNNSKTSGYAVTKFSAEMEVWRGIEEGLNAAIINPSMILGPGDWNQSSLSLFKVVKKGLRFYTPGMNAFVDARDVASAGIELLENNIFGERFLVVSENVYFKDLFSIIATKFNVRPPITEVKPWMTGLAWRIEGLLNFLFGRKQNITRETAKNSMAISQYSNAKISAKLNFQFIPIEKSIENAVNYFNNKGLKE